MDGKMVASGEMFANGQRVSVLPVELIASAFEAMAVGGITSQPVALFLVLEALLRVSSTFSPLFCPLKPMVLISILPVDIDVRGYSLYLGSLVWV